MNPNPKSTVLKTAQPIKITVYPPLPGSSCGGEGGCSCGPDPTQVLLQRLEDLKSSFNDRFHVEVVQYTTDAQLWSAMDRLNLALKASEVGYVVSETNLAAILTTATPILIVNNELVSSGNVPGKDALLMYFEGIA